MKVCRGPSSRWSRVHAARGSAPQGRPFPTPRACRGHLEHRTTVRSPGLPRGPSVVAWRACSRGASFGPLDVSRRTGRPLIVRLPSPALAPCPPSRPTRAPPFRPPHRNQPPLTRPYYSLVLPVLLVGPARAPFITST
jgi:hypothetical protein